MAEYEFFCEISLHFHCHYKMHRVWNSATERAVLAMSGLSNFTGDNYTHYHEDWEIIRILKPMNLLAKFDGITCMIPIHVNKNGWERKKKKKTNYEDVLRYNVLSP